MMKKSCAKACYKKKDKQVSKIFMLMLKSKFEWRKDGAFGRYFEELLHRTKHDRRRIAYMIMWYGNPAANRKWFSIEDLFSQTGIIMCEMMERWNPIKAEENDPYSVYLYINKTVEGELKKYIRRIVTGIIEKSYYDGSRSRFEDIVSLMSNGLNPTTATKQQYIDVLGDRLGETKVEKTIEDIKTLYNIYSEEGEKSAIESFSYRVEYAEEDTELADSKLYNAILQALSPIEAMLFKNEYLSEKKLTAEQLSAVYDISKYEITVAKRSMKNKTKKIASVYINNDNERMEALVMAFSLTEKEEKCNESDYTKLW